MQGILITAAAKRLGAEMARWASKKGFRVHIHYHTSKEKAHQLKEELEASGGAVFLHQADFRDEKQVNALIAECIKEGPLQMLINNASYFSHDTAQQIDEAGFDAHMQVNVKASALLMQQFCQAAQDPKVDYNIVNVTDARLYGLNKDYYSYTLSQYALEGATKMAALSYAPRVRINAIAPHMVLPNADASEEFDQYNRCNLLQRRIPVDDVLHALDFLYNASSSTGTTLILDAGTQYMPTQRDSALV